ncbi:Asp-tRNA(Asn)/Glu-tRNA(Gln) amidotransferase A subunit family amidase [Nocardioides marinisabuli]|uniref:Asp-tRNA(Asn)/Glu-tRNA(Gln) amidotransferase A subunit family amidase n=1 Tax=Nocardioides marinisabuli TaxID=419476 RepID=A0A7Y9F1S8_9ACTN|nr:AtzH-like domain-containing protein [Nocardioides marinisabuli]NYD57933.1 Asp-tRNA(Asn)/Glu-tRNA(Gln) amidotransferase A subunit family amidase [Nocardioides marinisabuli]
MEQPGTTPGPALPVPDGLVEAFRAHERAVAEGDTAALARFVAPGTSTLAGDPRGLLVGSSAITAYAVAPGPRRLVQTHVQVTDPDHALVVAVTEHASGGRGQQTQLWARTDAGWMVTAAHTSEPAPALDARVWRVVGDPLVPGTPGGPLSGESVAVKDVYAVAGHPVGGGNPAWEAAAPIERGDAKAVLGLVEAGADLRGIARTDELAWSLFGTNPHFGAPPNPRAPYRVPGGSSSGPASAVSLGHATIGLGTDTGGSSRVPAAYQGLYGVRTTHGAIGTHGVLALAPSFDTVGWMTRDADLLALVGDVLLPDSSARGSGELVLVPELLDLAEPDVREAVEGWVATQGLVVRESWSLGELAEWRRAFVTQQSWEAWTVRGAWLRDRLDVLGHEARARFSHAASIDERTAERAQEVVLAARARLRELVGDRVLVTPTTPSVAPLLGSDLAALREPTLSLTCLAPLAAMPAVTLPLRTAAGLPCGVSLTAAPGRDRDLLALAASLA